MLATLISSEPKRRAKAFCAAGSSFCAGKRSTPCSPSARRITWKSPSESGRDRSTPSIVAPRMRPLGTIWIISRCLSAAGLVVDLGEEHVLPALRRLLDRADLVHELRVFHRVLGHGRP